MALLGIDLRVVGNADKGGLSGLVRACLVDHGFRFKVPADEVTSCDACRRKSPVIVILFILLPYAAIITLVTHHAVYFGSRSGVQVSATSAGEYNRDESADPVCVCGPVLLPCIDGKL